MWLSEIFVVKLRAQCGAALQAVAGLCQVGRGRVIRERLSPLDLAVKDVEHLLEVVAVLLPYL